MNRIYTVYTHYRVPSYVPIVPIVTTYCKEVDSIWSCITYYYIKIPMFPCDETPISNNSLDAIKV